MGSIENTKVDTLSVCLKRKEKLTHLFDGLTKDDAIMIMSECGNIGEFLHSINERVGGSGYKRFYAFCSKYNINYNDYFKYDIRNTANRNKSIDDILVENSSYLHTNSLKHKLFKLDLIENKCVMCGNIGDWCGKKLSLHLDHINGKSNDNRLENLRILCPNCHSQTDTYCGRNRTETRVRKNKKHTCISCDNQVFKADNRCKECFLKIARKVKDRPTKEELNNLLQTNSYVSVGKMFNVSDNTIRKWLKNPNTN